MASEPKSLEESADKKDEATDQLLSLLRLLFREPPPEHDFKSCPICKRYKITEA
jgi:hypothetical protein